MEDALLETIHRFLGYAAVVAVVIGIAWSVVASRNQALGSRGFIRLQALVVILFVVASVAGVGLLISGAQPTEGLHLVYAAIAVGLLPLARSFVPASDRRAGLAALAAFVLLGFVLYRLFATG